MPSGRPWQGDWDAAWSGAITCDANVNLAAASAVAETIDALMIISQAHPDRRHNATRIFGTRGIVAPADTDGSNGRAQNFSATATRAGRRARPGWVSRKWLPSISTLLIAVRAADADRPTGSCGHRRVRPHTHLGPRQERSARDIRQCGRMRSRN